MDGLQMSSAVLRQQQMQSRPEVWNRFYSFKQRMPPPTSLADAPHSGRPTQGLREEGSCPAPRAPGRAEGPLQPPANGPRPPRGGSRAPALLCPGSLASALPGRPGAAAAARGDRDSRGRPLALGGPRRPDPPRSPRPQDPAGARGDVHAPGPGLWGGARPRAGQRGGRPGRSATRRACPARGSPRSGRAPPPPPARALLALRAFLGRHLFATRSLPRQVCLGACEHSSAGLSARLQPAPRGRHASAPVKRGPAALSPSAPLLTRPRGHLALLKDGTRT